MKSIVFLIVLVLTLPFMTAGAQALTALEQQEQFTVTAEKGRSVNFLLVVQNDASSSAQDVVITATGEVSSWISFDGSGSYTIAYIPAYYFAFVPVRVSVPDSTGLNEYSVDILADGSTISALTVRVVLSVADTELLQETSNMDEEISKLKDKLQEITDEFSELIDLTREDIIAIIMEMSEYNVEVSEIVLSKMRLEDRITELQTQLDAATAENQEFNGITSQVSLGNSINLTIGILAGAVLTLLFLKRKSVSYAIDSIVRPSKYKRREWRG